ncbi:MAG: glutamate--tRNA ligase [Burkholderiales bacterium]|nr:glutamate--tRNA ligase [Burkholderiales bacterium]MCA3160830.1 glutamate--tRNA ligase [Burkholderiales bacterium]MCA3163619.1 glutamate--tRNA ligase [Burkholderiales bacterium]MCA3166297.1 glutamate--tRNA ligase [Burkholderiales bacterium]MCA3170077.1 glutamate--tRNA ligase [Burkholderiales bacterium]
MTTLPQLTPVRSRFAPSPTGYLHLGGARTALFAWALARHLGGQFILRIEDTDLERSTPEAVQAILDGMAWLDLGYEEGPYYQMQRMERYREVIAHMLRQGTAYYCYSSPQELDAMREAQRTRGEKPRYDGRWRPERDKALPSVPEGVKPVVRFRNPLDGEVTWHDFVKGTITISNRELDDLIIARPDGTPTYNFCVVVDDWDMRITHVIRGDDHVNNTPRQINILKALGAQVPEYGHVPMILGPDGEKLSKRHGAVSVMQYAEQGYLPEAMINYLARLGWSHGDDEIFSREQLVQWFDVEHLSKSAAQWDPKKLNWLNQHYIKQADLSRLEAWVRPRVEQLGGQWQGAPALAPVLALLRDRCETLQQLAEAALLFYAPFQLDPALRAEHVTAAVLPALRDFAQQAQQVAWTKEALAGLIKTVITQHGLKMPQFAIPLRVLVTGRTQTPSVDAVLELLGRETVLARLSGL